LRFLYDYAWFVGFFVAASSYYLLMLRYAANAPALSTMTEASLNE
jgi:nucleobase:cation symporter-1, NCS1 family